MLFCKVLTKVSCSTVLFSKAASLLSLLTPKSLTVSSMAEISSSTGPLAYMWSSAKLRRIPAQVFPALISLI